MIALLKDFLWGLHAAWDAFWHPVVWEVPDDDTTNPQVIADWIASRKHPAECARGCRCDLREGGA